MENLVLKAKVLMEALPYIKRYWGKRVVIKYGGNAMEKPELQRNFASDIVLMRYVGINPIVVHGGGPQISQLMHRMGKEVRFVAGQRYTDEEGIEMVKMVLVGKVNKDIVSMINRHGPLAVGLSGDDGGLILARKRHPLDMDGSPVDLGFVGEVAKINTQIIDDLIAGEFIPVIATVGADENGQSFNINADAVAAELAVAVKADKIIFLTNVEGIYSDPSQPTSLISQLSLEECRRLLSGGRIGEGMIPKVEACVQALEGGVSRAHILNGTVQHAVLLEIFTDEGIGSMIAAG